MNRKISVAFAAILLATTAVKAEHDEPRPYGYEWVRVGADALLVDRHSGEVIRVEHDVFYRRPLRTITPQPRP